MTPSAARPLPRLGWSGIKPWFTVGTTTALALSSALPARAQGLTPIEQGRIYSEQMCASCHLLPTPEMLDLTAWHRWVQPMVRKRVGIDGLNPDGTPEEKLALEMWRSVWHDYIFPSAPQQPLPQPPRPPIEIGLPQFTVYDPQYRPQRCYATLVYIDETERQLYVGNALTRTLDVMDANGRRVSSARVDTTIVHLLRRSDDWLATQIGMITPDDRPLGQVTRYRKQAGQFHRLDDLWTGLVRPTHCLEADLDQDGLPDLAICSFGNQEGVSGQFAWYKNQGEGRYLEEILLARPGSTYAKVHDVNRDGRPDLVVLTSQAREGIYALLNEGDGVFSETPILRFPPVWGLVHFDLVDFNRDGHPDLLVSNGDLGDFPSAPRPYHGVRLYLNDGAFNFREAWFYPLNGAYRAVAADFDQDGDLDIAAISYFPDYARSPEESFVYLENQNGSFEFKAFSFPDSQRGHWLVMDVGDLDGDGDLDIVLGSATQTPFQAPEDLRQRWAAEGPSVLILRNNLRSSPVPLAEPGNQPDAKPR